MAIEMFKRGSVEMLALLILNEDDAHGYRIVQEIKDRSDGRLIIKEGSLYPILYKLSDEGYIISQEDISETKLGRKRIRVIYSIRRIYQFYWFQDGYVIETMYDGTDVPGPEEIGITNYRTY